MNCFILSLAILIPFISGSIILDDANSHVDVSLRQVVSPCCILKGNSCDISNCASACCSKKYIKTTCYRCGRTSTSIPATQCCPTCCLSDGSSCDPSSTCGNCCTPVINTQTCFQCA